MTNLHIDTKSDSCKQDVKLPHGRQKWMSDAQYDCALMFADCVRGFHHIEGKVRPWGEGITVGCNASRWATIDFDLLTRLVLMAHERCIRVALKQSGPRMVGFTLFKRKREGRVYDRHPTIYEAIETHTPSIIVNTPHTQSQSKESSNES